MPFRLVVFTKLRIQNSKGVLDKIFLSALGIYHVCERQVFHLESRNEKELRSGSVRNRDLSKPWSKGDVKKEELE